MKKMIRQLVNKNCADLEQSNKDFEAIYKIMFRLTDNVLAETNDGYEIQKYTYGDVQKRIETTSAALHARIGATHGYVGLEMENCVEWIVAFWAILRSGNKPYLVNCRHPKTLSDGILNTLNIQYVVSNRPTELNAEYIDINTLTEAVPFEGEFENEIALSTSATTLKETICFYTGKEIAAQLLNTKGVLKESEGLSAFYHGEIKQLAFLPFYHVFGLFAVYFWYTYFGRILVFMRDYAPDTILTTCRKHEVTHIFAVPMLWHTIEKKLLKQLEQKGEKTQKKFQKGIRICTALQNVCPTLGAKLAKRIMREVTDQLFGPSVQFCITGGSYIKTSTLELFNGIGYPLHNGYGMSEVGITSADLRNRPKELNQNTVGKPFTCVTYEIQQDGTLCIGGDSMCHARMIDGEYIPTGARLETGDVMECNESGQYIIQGRMGDVVIGENGENINPDTIEKQFALPDALQYVVLGIPQESEEVLSMIVAIHPYLALERMQQLMEQVYAINETLPMTSRIRKFYVTYDELAPKTAIKVGRKYVLRGLENDTIHLIPFSELSQQLQEIPKGEVNPQLVATVRRIVAEVLGIDETELGLDTHIILDLDTDSLQYFEILSRLAAEFDLQGTVGENEGTDTIREFCKYIEEHI
ncbi:MAG: AMP-binding protein [Lachnospiraceae bacterium]|nr:AMP-binding protein [Lachnospiraceae bacterium]